MRTTKAISDIQSVSCHCVLSLTLTLTLGDDNRQLELTIHALVKMLVVQQLVVIILLLVLKRKLALLTVIK